MQLQMDMPGTYIYVQDLRLLILSLLLTSRAEGFAAIMIKRLDKALIDGDTVYSIITGSSINSNGKGVSLTMPNADMQAETIRQAYNQANRKPSEAFFVELHATGTPVGDPIEANIVGQVFSEDRKSDKVLR